MLGWTVKLNVTRSICYAPQTRLRNTCLWCPSSRHNQAGIRTASITCTTLLIIEDEEKLVENMLFTCKILPRFFTTPSRLFIHSLSLSCSLTQFVPVLVVSLSFVPVLSRSFLFSLLLTLDRLFVLSFIVSLSFVLSLSRPIVFFSLSLWFSFYR